MLHLWHFSHISSFMKAINLSRRAQIPRMETNRSNVTQNATRISSETIPLWEPYDNAQSSEYSLFTRTHLHSVTVVLVVLAVIVTQSYQ